MAESEIYLTEVSTSSHWFHTKVYECYLVIVWVCRKMCLSANSNLRKPKAVSYHIIQKLIDKKFNWSLNS